MLRSILLCSVGPPPTTITSSTEEDGANVPSSGSSTSYSSASAGVAGIAITITRIIAVVINNFLMGYALLSFHPKVCAAHTCAKGSQDGGNKSHCSHAARLLFNRLGNREGIRLHRGYRSSCEDDSIPNDCYSGSICLASVISSRCIALHIADGLGASIGTNGSKPIPNLIVVGVVGVICLPLDPLQVQRLSSLCDCFGQMLRVGAGQVGVAPGNGDWAGFAAIAGRSVRF